MILESVSLSAVLLGTNISSDGNSSATGCRPSDMVTSLSEEISGLQ